MKIFQINTTVNSGSTGKIAEEIGKLMISRGHNSYIAYGRKDRPSESQKIKVGNKFGQAFHLINTRLFDRHGLSSSFATEHLIKEIKKINPDIIHLHNLHGYYINYSILFKYLKGFEKPVVWTLHDCWAFTGHCTYFDKSNCDKWKSECNKCPQKNYYPASIWIDRSKKNYYVKRSLFTEIEKMIIIVPSLWLARHVSNSFLNKHKVYTIYNGIDLNSFPGNSDHHIILKKYGLNDKEYILGVANKWDKRKGMKDFLSLRNKISDKINIVLVGLESEHLSGLPAGVIGIRRTENVSELSALYSSAKVFINPSYIDNLPTTNIEALACGIPVITYDTGGSKETIDENTGVVVEKGNTEELLKAVEKIISEGKEKYLKVCRERAEKYFNKDIQYLEYIKRYNQLLQY